MRTPLRYPYRFIKDAGAWGVASAIVPALLAFGIGLWDHAHDKSLSAFVFVSVSVPLFVGGGVSCVAKGG